MNCIIEEPLLTMRIPEGNTKNKSSKKVIEKIGFSHNIKKEEVQFYGRKKMLVKKSKRFPMDFISIEDDLMELNEISS